MLEARRRNNRMSGFKSTLSNSNAKVYNYVLHANSSRRIRDIQWLSWRETQKIAHGHTEGEIMVFSTIARLLGRPAYEGGVK